MKRIFPALAFSGLVALGFALATPSAQASAVSTSGMAAGAIAAADAAKASNVVQVDHIVRRHRYHSRDRHWRRHWRHHHHRPRAGFFFEFGTGRFRYGPPPYYAPPRIVVPRHVVPRRAYGLPAAHVRWCYARYRSYRAADNTFQPYHGPRRACRSPYWG